MRKANFKNNSTKMKSSTLKILVKHSLQNQIQFKSKNHIIKIKGFNFPV
jgi:hypothetical protein